MSEMKDLITKLEAASGGSRELDVRIAACVGHEHNDVHGRTFSAVYDKYGWEKMASEADSWHVPFYTTSIDAALTLVPEGLAWSIDSGYVVDLYAGLPIAQIIFRDGKTGNQSTMDGAGNTPSLAICIAALKARE